MLFCVHSSLWTSHLLSASKGYFSCRLPIVARKGTWHVTASTASTNVILTSRNYVSLCAHYWWWRKLLCPGMLIRKTAKPCINSTWIALIMDLCRLKMIWSAYYMYMYNETIRMLLKQKVTSAPATYMVPFEATRVNLIKRKTTNMDTQADSQQSFP